jgi:nitric oxide dioxygenase
LLILSHLFFGVCVYVQYISLQIDVPQLGHRQARQYSLSDHPDPNYYRISIKAERDANANSAPGLVSVLMHDTKHEGDVVRLSHPEGDFFLPSTTESDETTKPEETNAAPLVLISGGVGLTPLTSMLNSLVKENSTRPISWVHGARHSSARAFRDHVRGVAQSNPNVQFAWFNDQPQADEVQGQDYHHRGPIDLNKFDQDKSLFLNDSRTRYYVCGPPAFMLYLERELQARGVAPDRIHMEKFGVGA